MGHPLWMDEQLREMQSFAYNEAEEKMCLLWSISLPPPQIIIHTLSLIDFISFSNQPDFTVISLQGPVITPPPLQKSWYSISEFLGK